MISVETRAEMFHTAIPQEHGSIHKLNLKHCKCPYKAFASVNAMDVCGESESLSCLRSLMCQCELRVMLYNTEIL